MSDYVIQRFDRLSPTQKEEATAIFIEGFGHLFTFAEDRNTLAALFLPSFDEVMIYTAIEQERVVGFLGIGTNRKRSLCFQSELCKQLFGAVKGKIISTQLNMICTPPTVKKETDLYIDFLATSKMQRGKGIATQLLTFACSLPGYEEHYIEVLSKNENAKCLYEKMGFVPYKKGFNLFTCFQGLGTPIKMKKSIKN